MRVFCLLFVLLLAGGASGQVPDGPDFTIDTVAVMSPSYDDEQLPSAAFNGQNLFVGWYSWFGVGGARIRPDGTVLDIAGRKVMELQPGENDVSHLAPGVYFVRPASGAAHGAASITRVVVVR